MKIPWFSDENPVSKDVLDSAVLRIIGAFTFKSSDVAVQLGSVNQACVDVERTLIRKYREWLPTSGQSPSVERCFRGWLDYFDRRCDEAQRAIDTDAKGRKDRERMQRQEERRVKDAKVSEVVAAMPKPDFGRNKI